MSEMVIYSLDIFNNIRKGNYTEELNEVNIE